MERLRRTDIKYVKGVGPKRGELLEKELGIRTVADMVRHYPHSYVDRSKIYKIASFEGEMPSVQVRGRFISFTTQGDGSKSRLVGLFTDGSRAMEIVWFNRIRSIREKYLPGTEYVVFGKPTFFNNGWSMVHPEIDSAAKAESEKGMRGVYPLTEKLRNRSITSRTLYEIMKTVRQTLLPTVKDPLPRSLRQRLGLMELREALEAIHFPENHTQLQKARERLKFEELFYLQLNILRYCRNRDRKSSGYQFKKIGRFFNGFYNEFLPFPLTEAQKKVIREIRADLGSGRQMNRLLQGDVGSGKTLVALMCMLIALDNGSQACLMAPTEILASQHYETISKLVGAMGINVKLLTGSTPGKARERIHNQLEDGTLHILIGTHAVIEDNVKFRNLGFVVIDEQHRFGVAQRARLWGKNFMPPHVLVMTATPIPRTLAMTVYGDLDVSVIDELPPGRKPVHTSLRYDQNRLDVYKALGRQLKEGRQAYIVYPLIKENEKVDMRSLEVGYQLVKETFPSYRVAYVHGRMKPAEKDHQMMLFATHQADILVATTVIEVGVNVPNATTMIIENAERFGLSQLHQLRGRVGRGGDQSFCVLMTKTKIAKETRKRLEIMTSTTDGFLVAEADLKMRGPGDLEGTLQSGMAIELKIANLATDGQIVQLARDAARDTLDSDPELSAPELAGVRREMTLLFNRSVDWSQIS
ncbi:MAG: ATP-dependent DNA helicase RecG [Paramuribaculum sp.]|nr:ATP-dependent DNA helicase RecG [Paramuribaculum sp.]